MNELAGFCIPNPQFSLGAQVIKIDMPVISFPGDAGQVVPTADAIFFLSMISGRNPELLIGQQVRAAPLLKEYGVEVISTGYMLIESGSLTSTEYMSSTRPMPRNKQDIAMAHALAAEFLGMKLIYLETGSGAGEPVPDALIRAVVDYITLPVVVGQALTVRGGHVAAMSPQDSHDRRLAIALADLPGQRQDQPGQQRGDLEEDSHGGTFSGQSGLSADTRPVTNPEGDSGASPWPSAPSAAGSPRPRSTPGRPAGTT